MPLSGYTILDLTNERGELASMILGDLGADVIKVEPPQGSSSRRQPPFIENGAEAERSLRFFAYNRNKRSVTLDLFGTTDRSAFLSLVRQADFLFESSRPGEMANLGLGFDDLKAINPRLVYVAITPFGQDGPYADFAATDLTIAALAGPMSLQGIPERAPLRISVPQVWLHASAEAAIGALIAHARMLQTGEAQFVDVSAQAAMVFTMFNAQSAYAIQGFDFERGGSALQLSTITLPLVYPCANGHVVLLTNGAFLVRVVPWLIEAGIVPPEWAGEDWRTFDLTHILDKPARYSLEEIIDAVRRFVSQFTKEQLLARGLAENVTIAPVNTAEDLAGFRQLEARNYWAKAILPDGRTINTPGVFARLTATPISLRLPPPRLGQHTGEVLSRPLSQPTPETLGKFDDALPLQGLKVADFSWIGVGPITAKYLADHGATVVRVETQSPADRLRSSGPFKDAQPGTNRSQYFGEFNTSKLGLALNLKNPTGIEVARKLIAWADVYIESFTPGTVSDLGIGYETARSLNPSIVMVSTCLMGQTGPASRLAGFGYHAAAIAGFNEVMGWPDLPPDAPWQAYTDTVGPRFLASTLLAAIDHTRRTSEGQHIDFGQLEAALHFLSPEILDFNANGRVAHRLGNRDLYIAPHGVYPCAGQDQWCAIAVETDEQWHACKQVLANPAWAYDPLLDMIAGRLASQDELDAHISAWTRGLMATEVMQLLQEANVPAGVVQRSSDLLSDPQLSHRAYYRYLNHAEMGQVPYGGHQFRIRGYDSGPRSPSPLLGEHNEAILRDLLGLNEDDVTEAFASGAIS